MNKKELTLREVQLGEYEVLKRIIEICDKQGYKYFLIYGSLLGAVRENGIIPWDDDIDIMMPRPDYEKLLKYFQQNAIQLKPLKLFEKSVEKEYPHMIIRISNQNYHLDFDNEKDYGIGLFVDIYPLDGVGNDYKKAVKLIKRTKKLASLCFLTSRKKFGTDNTISKWKMLIKFPAYIWANFLGNDHYYSKLSQLSKKLDYENSKYVACAMWPAGIRHGIDRDVFDKSIFETIKWKFEESEINIPKGYEEFLKRMYGDYMTPPPENRRKTNHTYRAFEL